MYLSAKPERASEEKSDIEQHYLRNCIIDDSRKRWVQWQAIDIDSDGWINCCVLMLYSSSDKASGLARV